MITHVGLFGSVLRHVTQHYEISAAQILGEGRRSVTTEARWFCCWLLRREGLSFLQIGRLLNKDHSSVLHAVNRLDERRRADSELNGRLMQLHHAVTLELAPRSPEIVCDGWGMMCGQIGYSFGETVGCVSRETAPA